jgi:two-component system phosphate regulon sensor histidine kinase PhoR
MKRSFFLKLLSGYILITIILSGVMLLFSLEKIRGFYVQSLSRDLKSMGMALQPAVIPLLEKGRYAELDAVVKKLDPEIHARITIVDQAGAVLADSEQNPAVMENHGNRPEIREALTSRAGTTLRYSTTVREKMLYVAIPLVANDKKLGALRVSFFLKDINSFIAALKNSLFHVTLLVALLALAFSLVFTRSLVKPVRLLTAAARRIATGNFDAKVELDRKDEFSDLAGSFNYMTDRIRALFAELSQQKEEIATIIDSLQGSLLVIGHDEKVVLSNRSFQKIAGNDRIEGKFYWEAVREAEFSKLIKAAFNEQKSLSADIAIGDTSYFCSVSYLPAKKEVVIVMNDITEIRRLEKIKKDLTVNVSHELRTPLSAIKGYVETLEDSIDEKNRRYLDIVKRHTERLINIVEDLLSLSDLEEKGIVFTAVQVNDIVNDVMSIFTQKLERKKLTLKLNTGNGLPSITGDRFRLEQMLINLVDNAIKYTESGTIEIATRKKGDAVELVVSDTGIGIPQEHLERIFERFYVVDKSRSRKLGGTGLGLSIVKHIVLLHNGTVQVDSTPGKGTTFTVTLPIASSMNK